MALRATPWRDSFCLAIFAVGLAAFALAMVNADFRDAQSYGAALNRDGIYPDYQLAGSYLMDAMSFGRGYVYPPTSLIFLAPLALGAWTYPLLSVGSTIALVVAVLLIIRQEVGLTIPLALAISGVTLALYPTAVSASSGQVNMVVAASFGAAWVVPRSAGWLGVAGGLLKVFPAALLFWAVRRRAPLIKPFIAGALAVGFTVALWGIQVWFDYGTVALNAEPSCNLMARLSVHCVTGNSLIGFGLAAVLLMGALFVRGDEQAFALLGLAIWAATPEMWPHYWLVVGVAFLPFALQRFRRGAAGGTQERDP